LAVTHHWATLRRLFLYILFFSIQEVWPARVHEDKKFDDLFPLASSRKDKE
jgi:hypothetical protein